MLFVGMSLLLNCDAGFCLAADPAGETRPCVLLTNDNVLYGTAKQTGEWVLVRNGDGNESRLPRQNVACWANSIRDLYQFRIDRRRPGNLQDLLADARWCLDHELLDETTQLITEIRKYDPDGVTTRLLENRVQHRTAPTDQPTASIPSVETTSHSDASEASSDDASVVGLAELRSFASQIQPLLANRCGNCHSDPSERAWSLMLPAHGMRPSSRMTRENIRRTILFVDTETPESSELLVKALTPHGGTAAALDANDARALEAFRLWIRRTTSSISQANDLPLERRSPDRSLPPPVLPLDFDDESIPAESGTDALPVPPSRISMKSQIVDTVAPVVPRVSRLPEVSNPFDPEIFNRKFHPPQPAADTP